MTVNFEAHSFCAKLLQNEKDRADEIYLRQPIQGQWYEFTWKEALNQARKVAAFLVKKGLKKGDRVAIISKNCAEWFITDFGIALAGMVNVPLFSNQNEENIQYILQHADIKMVFLGKLDHPKQIHGYIPGHHTTVNFGYHNLSADYQWQSVMDLEPLADITPPSPDDIYTIIYTSGTSSTPKGAVYTHQSIANYLEVYPRDIRRISDVSHYQLISYLPLAHVYERTAIQLGSLTIPCHVSFVESLEKFADNLRDIQPTLFTAVPRIWGVFKQKIQQKVPPRKLNLLLKIPVVSSLVKKKIRHQLGLSHCTNCFSGASHVPLEILEFFASLGIVIQEGYGQTENLAYATFSELKNNRVGYVGSPRLGVEIKKGDQDELLIRSRCLMKEYHQQKELNEKVFTSDGWLRTGDIVEIDEMNRVKILGRLSEIFKNQKGEFINPTPIEEAFGTASWMEQNCLIGQKLPSNVMLVNINEEGKKLPQEQLEEKLKKMLSKVNRKLRSFEKISHVLVTKDTWSIDNDMLTPTLKIKRRFVENHYADQITIAIGERKPIQFIGS